MTAKRITNGLTVAIVAMGMMAGAANAAPWTPAEISSTTNVLWLDAADTSTITDSGGAVSQWNDKSGNGNNVTNASAGNQPLTSSYAIGTNNVIRFDTPDTLETLGGAGSNPLGATIEDVFVHIVLRRQTFANWDYTFSVGRNEDRLGLNGSTGSVEYKSRNQNLVGSWLPAVGTVFQGGYYGSTTEATMEAWHDGSKSGEAANALAASSVTQGIVVGGRIQNTADSGVVDIAEFIVLKGVRDTNTQEKIEGYLAWKWGIEGSLPVGHPYKSAAPEGGHYIDLTDNSVPSNAAPGTLVGTLSMMNTNGTFAYSLESGGDNDYFDISTSTTNLRTATWLDSDSYSISIIGTEQGGGGLVVTNDFTITVNSVVIPLVFVVSAEVQNGSADGTVVGTAETVQSAPTFSVCSGRTDLFYFDGSDLKATNSADWGGVGTTNYVTIKAVSGALTNELVVAAAVISGSTTGTIFLFQ